MLPVQYIQEMLLLTAENFANKYRNCCQYIQEMLPIYTENVTNICRKCYRYAEELDILHLLEYDVRNGLVVVVVVVYTYTTTTTRSQRDSSEPSVHR